MDVQIVNRARVVYAGDLPVSEYTVTCAAARELGSATTEIPYDHPALRAIPAAGSGAYLSIRHGTLGPANYLLLKQPKETDRGVRCEWSDPLAIKLTVENRETFVGALAGTIAASAIKRATQGRTGVPFDVGTVYRGTPISFYEFRGGESLLDILADLADRTGEEWALSPDGKRLNWQPAGGSLWPAVLHDGFTCVRLSPPEGEDERVMRVIAYDQQEIPAIAEAPQWYHDLGAETRVIRVDAPSEAAHQQAARDELARLSTRRRTYEIGLLAPFVELIAGTEGTEGSPEILFGDSTFGAGVFGGAETPASPGNPPVLGHDIAHWAIQPGDLVRLVLTSGRQTETPLVRVLARTYGDNHTMPVYRMQSVAYYTGTTIHAARYGTGPLTTPPKTLARAIAGGANQQSPFFLMAPNLGSIPTSRLNEPVPDALLKEISIDKVIGDFPAPEIGEDAITDLMIADVSAAKITGELATAQIADGAIDDAKISDVAQAKIAWTLGTVAPTATNTRWITIQDGATQYRIRADSVL